MFDCTNPSAPDPDSPNSYMFDCANPDPESTDSDPVNPALPEMDSMDSLPWYDSYLLKTRNMRTLGQEFTTTRTDTTG